jgi:hypothetical protein
LNIGNWRDTFIIFSTCKLLVNLLLEAALRISTLLISTRLVKLLGWGRRLLYDARINIHTAWFTNTLSIDFLGFDNKDSIRKGFLALSARELVWENLDFDTENTLTEENVTGSKIDKIPDLIVNIKTMRGVVLVDQSESWNRLWISWIWHELHVVFLTRQPHNPLHRIPW